MTLKVSLQRLHVLEKYAVKSYAVKCSGVQLVY